jgi:non-specific serine/threonine protein kinase/serine/threonine-protein kinase
MAAPERPADSHGEFDETRAVEAAHDDGWKRIGPYRLIQRIGDGGMGEVWLAQQLEPVQRQVAIKLIKPGMDSARVIARFEAERQTLALMDHPAISKVFEAGTTPEGRPYFAMEYVRGDAITTYCDRQRLTVRERIELFIQLCDGVQHAHQKGIIHRDLKPSNVLVSETDDRPIPRIIDFGIAKAMAQPLTERSLMTEMGSLVGTPEYMSPEQAEMTPLDVDTRSDVYSLGLLLYELLVGVLPFDREALRNAPLDEVRRTIREVEAPRPSTQATRVGDSAEVAARRQTQPGRLASLLRGDLDWVTKKALEKERSRRYATANALAMDLRRHLLNEPVLAGPPSAIYRVGKFVRRHRVAAAAGGAIALLLVAFAATMAVQAGRIARERDRANQEAATAKQVSDFMVSLFRGFDPSEARGNTLTAREVLSRGARRIDEDLRDQPQVQARMRATIGTVYTGLGLYAEAEAILKEAMQAQQRVLGEDSAETLATEHALANAYWYQRKYSEAEPLYVNVVNRRTRALGVDHRDTLQANFDLASVYLIQKRWPEYEKLGLETLARQRRVLGDTHFDTLSSLNNLNNFYYLQGRYAEAEPIGREVFTVRARTLGPDHPSTLLAQHNLAANMDRLGLADAAEKLFLDVLDRRQRVLGKEHPSTATTLHILAASYARRKRYTEAEPLALSAHEAVRKTLGEDHQTTRDIAALLAAIYDGAGRPREAAEWRTRTK